MNITPSLALSVATTLMLAPAVSRAEAAPNGAPPAAVHASATGPGMLGTSAVPVRAQRFNADWARAMEDASRASALHRLVAPASGMTRIEQIRYVQSRVHTSIRWVSDATQWGKHDYWATAEQTLAQGAGDMEDRAIVKMHALRALGFSPNDLFITLARDRVGGPMTVLVVRLGSRYFILDDTGGAPFPAESRQRELQPVLSFGWNGAWVHARNAPARAIAAAASQSGGK